MRISEPTDRLMRWRLRLNEFTFVNDYKKANFNTQANVLSRLQSLEHTTVALDEDILAYPDDATLTKSNSHRCLEQMCRTASSSPTVTRRTSCWYRPQSRRGSGSSRPIISASTWSQDYRMVRTCRPHKMGTVTFPPDIRGLTDGFTQGQASKGFTPMLMQNHQSTPKVDGFIVSSIAATLAARVCRPLRHGEKLRNICQK